VAYIRQSTIKTKNTFFKKFFAMINKEFGKANVEKYFYYPDNYDFNKGLVKKLQIKISKDLDISKSKKPFDTLKGLKSSSGKDMDFGEKSKINFHITGGKNGSGKLPIKGESVKSPTTAQQEMGTIFCIETFLDSKKFPTLDDISDEIGFIFDPDYYHSFKEQVQAVVKSKTAKNASNIFLDSASSGSHSNIFKKLKKLGYKDKKDNWNPADIWIFNDTKGNIEKTLDEASSVNEFNDAIKSLFQSNKLIGASLKKISKVGNHTVVDPSKREPITFTFKDIDYKQGQSNFMINSKEGFIIRAGFKAGAGKVYYEGKMAKAKVQLGAISKIYITDYIKKALGNDIMELEAEWKTSQFPDETRNGILLEKSIQNIEAIVKKDKDFLKNMYYSSMKQMDTSSIYLKIY